MARPGWSDYFLRLAYMAATRATCPRKHVGCLIVDPRNHVIATGYNGAPSGLPSCDEVGCDLVDNHCVRTIHSEANAISNAGRLAYNCTVYCTCIPCLDCAKLITNVGIKKLIYDEDYSSRYGRSSQVAEYLRSAGLEVQQYDSPMLAMFKKMLSELTTLESEVLSTQLVEFACGCTAPALTARALCPKHERPRVRE